MLRRVVLGLRRWIALRKFPRRTETHLYLYFDYYVPLGNAHDTIMIYESGTVIRLVVQQTEALGDIRMETTTEISVDQKNELFRWLRDRLSSQANLWRVAFCKDPVKMELFCCDEENAWQRSIVVSGLQCVEELRPFRGDFIEKVKQMASTTRLSL